MNLRAILISVNYHDLLALTLPYNRHHFSSVFVVTTPTDEHTKAVAAANGCHVVETDLFYEGGATFNKWAALEYGLDLMGRDGWICVMDADICWPKQVPKWEGYLQAGCLYTPLRRMGPLTTQIPPESKWKDFRLHRNTGEWAGYSQIFHAGDPHLGEPPWYENWKHAGGADSFFQKKWPRSHKVRPSFEVLHLGPAGVNWCGRTSDYVDGSKPEGWQKNKQALRNLIANRSKNRKNSDPFKDERC